MNYPNSRKEEINNNNKRKIENSIGLDIDEQIMNGLYGMAETKVEDSMPHGEEN